MTDEIELYKRRFEREKNSRLEAESLLENKSRELYFSHEALKELTANLEKMVQERTQELKIAHDKAIASDLAKSLFLANMSHEIRTPMNGILGVIHLLESTPLSDKQRRLIATAKGSSELLLAIINDILDVGKIEAGELTLTHSDFNIVEVIESSVSNFYPAAKEKNIALQVTMGELPTRAKGDATRIRQVLFNLLNNAIKFTEQGSITIRASLTDEQLIEISVADTGIGIPPEKIDSIFAPFNKADQSVTRKFGGTGLGLAICTHLTELMGRKIQVRSQLGKGSCFTFWLALEIANEAPHTTTTTPSSHLRRAQKFSHGRTLLVDDNPVNREIGSEILREYGLTVDCAENGAEAVTALLHKPYDLVLMDIQMPVMDGLTAAQRIRAQGGHYKEIPIIAMTAHAQPEDIEKSLAAGMNAHLTKPIQPHQVFTTLAQWLPVIEEQAISATAPLPIAAPTAAQSASAVGDDEIPFIDGIDIKESLMRANNNKALLKKVLISFAKTHADDIKKLHCHYENSELTELQALAHKIKGSGATIGAKELAKVAAELESNCKKNEHHNDLKLIGDIAAELHKIIPQLLALNQTNTNSSATTLSASAIKTSVNELKILINSDLTRAEKILDELIASSGESAFFEKIKLHFDAFEMDDIIPLLDQFSAKLA